MMRAALMAQGSVHLANVLGGKGEMGQLLELQETLRARHGGDGSFYADQYGTALGVFLNVTTE